MKDISKLSKLGGRTISLDLSTTITAVTIGLVLANIINPCKYINAGSRKKLLENFASDAAQKIKLAESAKNKVPLQPLVDIVPDNFFNALTDNTSMLQVNLFAIDRPLDMCRTVVIVTSDATVSVIVAKSVGILHKLIKED